MLQFDGKKSFSKIDIFFVKIHILFLQTSGGEPEIPRTMLELPNQLDDYGYKGGYATEYEEDYGYTSDYEQEYKDMNDYGYTGGYDNGYKSYDRVAKELGENLTDEELQVLFSTLIFLEFRLISV